MRVHLVCKNAPDDRDFRLIFVSYCDDCHNLAVNSLPIVCLSGREGAGSAHAPAHRAPAQALCSLLDFTSVRPYINCRKPTIPGGTEVRKERPNFLLPLQRDSANESPRRWRKRLVNVVVEPRPRQRGRRRRARAPASVEVISARVKHAQSNTFLLRISPRCLVV